MNEHTPGPWQWWTSNSWRRLRRSERGKTTDVLMPLVCRDGQPDIQVTEADMHLIAAAPELLEALKAIMALPHAADQLDYLKRGIGTNTPAKAWLEARAAIARAEGREPQ